MRAAFAFTLALVVLPAAPPVHGMQTPLVIAAACDFVIGAAIGFAASILYDGAYAGGRMLDDYAGIRGSAPGVLFFAASGFGRIWSTIFTAGYFLLGGYRIAIVAFARSFANVPPGSVPQAHGLYAYCIALASGIVQAALLVAAPAIAIAFIAQLALGALTRVIPRFAAFALSFPIVFGLVLIVTMSGVALLAHAAGRPWLPLPFLR